MSSSPLREEVFAAIVNHLIVTVGVNSEQVIEDAELVRDLGASSLELIEFQHLIEDQFNILLSVADWNKKMCVKELMDMVFALAHKDSSDPPSEQDSASSDS